MTTNHTKNPFSFLGNISKQNRLIDSLRKSISSYTTSQLLERFEDDKKLAELGYEVHSRLPLDVRSAGKPEDLVKVMIDMKPNLMKSKKNRRIVEKARSGVKAARS